MRNAGLAAAAFAAVVLAAALTAFAPARSDEDPWSEEAVKARFPDPDAGAKKEAFAPDNSECNDCHDDRVASLATSFHRSLGSTKKSGTRGCQECHGPAGEHLADEDVLMRNPGNAPDSWFGAAPPPPKPSTKPDAKPDAKPRGALPVTVKAMNGACLRCHYGVLTKPVGGHREWLGRTRDPSGERSCVSCHSVHVDRTAPMYDAAIGPFATAAAGRTAKAEYSDPAQCMSCHTEFHPQMARSGHAYLMKGGEDHGCGACHGPGDLHVASGGDPKKIVMPQKQRPADADASCNACHSKRGVTAKWTCSEHGRQGVTCIVCHDANAPRGATLRAPEFELCGKCHLDVQAQFRLPNRHRVAEGRVSCSDCHDPHGNTDKVRDKDVRYRACAVCHAEKAGPFLFDHGIKRTEGCTACHAPHGSSNRRMLTYARIQPMCLQCHPETPHDLRKPRFTNCLDCHTEIHGSDLDRSFLK